MKNKVANKKQLKDYIQYYIGQEISNYWDDKMEIDTIAGYASPKVILEFDQYENEIHSSLDLSHDFREGREPKLLLRSLSDMTEQEAKFITDNYSFRSVDMPMNLKLFAIEISKRLSEQTEVVLYLLSQGFDLFGLIESGLAIEKNTI